MRVAIILMIMIMIETSEGICMNKYVKNVNKAIYNKCNREAHIITNNTNIYKCLIDNSSYRCGNLENFTEYNNLRFKCINRNNSEIGCGILISIIIWTIISVIVF